jgi:ribokinase
MSNIEVVGLGALNIDHLYQVERILEDGEVVVNWAETFAGGSAANTIHGLAKLGVNTGFIGVVGDDTEGKVSIQDLQKVGVDTSQIRRKSGARTGLVLCLSDRQGKRSLYVTPGANNLITVDDFGLTYVNRARMIHISSLTDDRQFQVLRELMGKLDSSIKVSFAPGALYAAKGLKALTPILVRTHVLFINQNELRQLTGEDIIVGTEICLKHGCHMVAVTLGKGVRLELGEGVSHKIVTAVSHIRDADNEYAIEATNQRTTSEVDTTGAGDAFAAGFLYGLLKGKGLEECGHLGDIVAQFSITRAGARDGSPSLAELTNRYRKLYSKRL